MRSEEDNRPIPGQIGITPEFDVPLESETQKTFITSDEIEV